MTTPARLSALLAGIADVSSDVAVTGLSIDSRTTQSGDLFVAFPGVAADGRRFIADAVAHGAAGVVYEADDGFAAPECAVPCLGVRGLRPALGTLADRFYRHPSGELTVVGVTGTNGKTTCTQLLAQALDHSDHGRCAVIGTLGYGFPGALDSSLHTTPDAVTVHRLLREFRGQGAAYASMEVSSHALDQGRVNAVAFAVNVFTNLTRDHLDYHGDMAAYGAAKARLFVQPGMKTAVINVDDEFGRALLGGFDRRVRVMTYGFDGGAVRVRSLKLTPKGMQIRVSSPEGPAIISSQLFGRFNAYNLLAVFSTLLALGIEPAVAAQRLALAQPAAGRMERFTGATGSPMVVVDYAHSPDALEQVLSALRPHTRGRLVCVFGCGGDRDRGKRPQMGAVAERLADHVILTDDNPRTEDPEVIVTEIRAGMQGAPSVIRDRRSAIAEAIASAGENDVVLVAGKGHEDYQQVGQTRIPYSDRTTVREILGVAA